MTQISGALGLLQLQNTPQTMLGSLTFSFPLICRRIPDAWVKNVVYGAEDDTMESAFISAAKELVRVGAVAITTNCGFAIKYQKAMARSLSVPVSTSSLLLLPYLLAAIKGRIGILTFDSRPLTFDLLKLAGVEVQDRIAVAGIENSDTWRMMSQPENNYTVSQLTKDVLGAIALMRKRHGNVQAILFECAAFPLVAQPVREQTSLPVYDAVTNAKLLMSGVRDA
ncbi:hypothetical protein QCM77_42915 [Bradyrhizobium sp. SSUT18]|uniref:hypothetical protein n=1 Tax=Bradyrhizobium sp. SSUT18 TaxID=3040602 RepID=UPI00244C651E|nr:hypothetical protein [Bradyrhizobium sp. SSUT18]MDH2406567.1 hypothetical protein [Bradyrhizobium sp. SSUT18]